MIQSKHARNIITGIIVGVACIAGAVTVLVHSSLRIRVSRLLTGIAGGSSGTTAGKRSDIEAGIYEGLRFLETYDEHITVRHFVEDTTVEINARIPSGKPIEWILWHLSRAASRNRYSITDCLYEADTKRCRIEFTSPRPRSPRYILVLSFSERYFKQTATIALIIGPFSFRADEVSMELLAMEEPLTLGLLPERRKSSWTANMAGDHEKEVLVMLPMESLRGGRSGDSGERLRVMVHYSDDRIRSIIGKAMKQTPGCGGIMNFQGERVLEDTRVMKIVIDEIARHHGYFIENRTSDKSVVPGIVKKSGIPFGSIEESIREDADTASVTADLSRLAVIARKKGTVIARAPATRDFVAALKSTLPVFRRNGIALEYVSAVVSSMKGH